VSGANEITVALPIVSDTTRVEKAVGTVAQLSFYDWEANVLTPNGKTAASQLQDRNPTALKISQGAGSLPPGSPGAGSMGLYPAVLLASEQPENASSANSRITPQYFLFGAAGSAACEAAANANGTVPAAGQHCLLSGPADNKSDLLSGLPPGVSASEGQILSVPRGPLALQAISPNFARPVSFSDPNAQFFVLTDNVALRGSDITNPEQSTDPSTHKPDITFGFTSEGKTMFQRMTADVARRGSLVSDLGQTLNQHFAVVLDHQLIAVPYIDYKIYPDGVTANAADLSSGLTAASTRTLAAALRLGALPLNLKLICGPPAATPCHFPRER
jgi:SecD/SecF fusion protein